jgi:hypothetical protein
MNNQKDFKRLYLKYKNKYLSLKNSINIKQKGGANYQNDTGHLPGIHGPPPIPPRASAPPIPPRASASPRHSSPLPLPASPVARLPTGPTHTITNNYIDPYSPLGYNPLGYNPGYRKKIYYDYDRRDDDYYDDYDDYDDDYDKPRRRRTSRRKTSRRKSTKKKSKRK